jgi:NitT/TauT family transport system substrate-binding protein
MHALTGRAPGNENREIAMTLPTLRDRASARRLTCLAALGASVALAAPAQATDVKFMMDWAWQGPQAFALMARNEGCFEAAGVNITLDRGFGSGRVPVELATGTYQMGLGDLNPTIKFRAENPDSDVITTAILFAGSPLVTVVRNDRGVTEPADLEGKTLAAPDFDAGRQLFPVFAAAAGFDAATVNWLSVDPALREPMMVRGEADGISGFVTSAVPSLIALGMSEEDFTTFYYKDYGAELFSTAVLTTRAFAEANPEAVAAVTACMIRGVQLAEADPEGAIEALVAHEPLTDAPVELVRWQMTIDDMLRTDMAVAEGISTIDMDMLQRSIMSVEDAYGLPHTLQATDLFDPSFLPPAEARMFLAD